MVRDAEEHKAADEARKKLIEARNEADSLIYSTEKSLEEHGAKLSDEVKAQIAGTVEEAKKALEGEDAELISEKVRVCVSLCVPSVGPLACVVEAEATRVSRLGDDSLGQCRGVIGGKGPRLDADARVLCVCCVWWLQVKALQQAALKIGEAVYGKGAQGGAAGEQGGAAGDENKENVQDAEFKEKDDKEKK